MSDLVSALRIIYSENGPSECGEAAERTVQRIGTERLMVKRWMPGALGGMKEADYGEWIHEDDYDALAARLAEAERSLERLAYFNGYIGIPALKSVAETMRDMALESLQRLRASDSADVAPQFDPECHHD